ncbi:hypothetical protein ACN27F_24085 [Solwaraspora sp. WMMB335]|uniref:hypothetical protein n=1 Tax=Solwaraspora sp. WMMB335 TaxID=3404118 RepID=UPI003B960A35
MIGLTTVAVVALLLIFVDPAEQTFASTFVLALLPSAFLLPVLGVLLVTTEWSQRTALTTFALIPLRHRVLGAGPETPGAPTARNCGTSTRR